MTEQLQDEMYTVLEKAKDQLNQLFYSIEENENLSYEETQQLESHYDKVHSHLSELEQLINFSS